MSIICRNFAELCDSAVEPVHTLELPDGVKLNKTSYDVFLRYILFDVVAA